MVQCLQRFYFLFYHESVCCVFSAELPQWGSFNEYIQQSIIFIEDQNDIPKLSPFASRSGSMNKPQWLVYQRLEQITIVPKMFEPLKLDCI